MDIVTLAERPDLVDGMWELSSIWPDFMHQDPSADYYYARTERWAGFVLLAVDGDRVVGRGMTVPFFLDDGFRGPGLPDEGWAAVVRWSWHDDLAGRVPNLVAGLEVSLLPAERGTGLAGEMLAAMRANTRRHGIDTLVIPVRPSRKHEDPRTPIADYVARTRADGLPVDSWLRLHVRLGGEILAVCPRAMTISGSLAEWRRWTGLPFDRSGDVEVPGALVPVHVDIDQDHAVYVEPNVWVRHAC